MYSLQKPYKIVIVIAILKVTVIAILHNRKWTHGKVKNLTQSYPQGL